MESLKKTGAFKRVYNSRNSAANRLLVLYKRANGEPVTRLGISISRKVGNAVLRNRIKRIVKENFRGWDVSAGFDLVVVVRPSVGTIPRGSAYREIGHALAQLLRRQKLLALAQVQAGPDRTNSAAASLPEKTGACLL